MVGNVYYVVDTSSFIEIKTRYPPQNFAILEEFEILIHYHRLGSPIEVLDELSRKDDDIYNWCKGLQANLFYTSLDQIPVVQNILKNFPKLVNVKSDHDPADPYVIAMARNKKNGLQQFLVDPIDDVIVVTEEKSDSKKRNRCIPDVCAYYGIQCISLLKMIELEGWRFKKI